MKRQRNAENPQQRHWRTHWRHHLFVLAAGLAAAATAPAPVSAINCPNGGATLEVCVNNPTGTTSPSITVSGNFNSSEPTCLGPVPNVQSSYTYTTTYPPGETCTTLPSGYGLSYGMYVHRISVASTTQNQYQQGVMLYAAPGNPKPRVDWTYFPSVVTVSQAGDAGGGSCPVNGTSSTCDIRRAVTVANGVSGTDPVLIQFTASPGTMSGGNLTLTRTKLTLDGTDSNGNPWIVGDASAAAAGNQDAIARVMNFDLVGGLRLSASNITLKGLDIKQTPPTGTRTQFQHLVQHTTALEGTVIVASRLDGGTTSDCGIGADCSPAWDLLHLPVRASPATVSADVTLYNVEGRSAIDQGLELLNETAVSVEQSWIHNNYKGNVRGSDAAAITSARNVVERAGLRAGDDLFVDGGANGIRVNNNGDGGSSTILVQDGDIVRNNVVNGVRVSGRFSSLGAGDTSWCGNGADGLLTTQGGIQNAPPLVAGQGGLTAAYNQSNGADVRIDGSVSVTLNNESSFPSNAQCGLYNRSPGTTVDASGNQWRGTAPFTDTCPSGSPGGPAPGAVDSSSPVDAVNDPVFVNATTPTNVILKGQTIRVLGNGFNSIDGNPVAGVADCTTGYNGSGFGGQQSSCCNKTARSNTCTSLHDPGTIANGHCVELQDSLGGWSALAVKSVTPRLIEGEVPATVFRCFGGSGELVQVTKRIGAGLADTVFDTDAYCTHADPF